MWLVVESTTVIVGAVCGTRECGRTCSLSGHPWAELNRRWQDEEDDERDGEATGEVEGWDGMWMDATLP